MVKIIFACKKALHGIWVGLLRFQATLIVSASVICLLCMVAEVSFRHIKGIQLFGFEEVASAVSIWLYFPAAAYATHEGTHLSAEVYHLFLKTPKSESRWKAVISIITLGLACYVLTWSYDYFIWGLTMGEYIRIGGVVGSFPSVYSHAGIFVGCHLIVLYFAVEAIKHLRAGFKR